MKKFSTAARPLALAASVILTSIFASPAALAEPSTGVPNCEFLPNAPDQHTVVRGDTLWDISGKFLKHPWCWPHVWGMNKDEIKNPHWIYPGQIVYFDRVAGRLRLGTPTGAQGTAGAGGGIPTVRLSPQARIQGIGKEAIPAIPSNVIEPFLSQPLIVEENDLKDAPHIMATQEQHVYLGKNDRAYVRGDLKGGTSFQVFRPAKPLTDPETGKVIAYESVYLGTVKLDRAGKTDNEAHRFIVVSSKEEMGEGDLLSPVPPTPIFNYMPHAPNQPIDARILSIYGGVSQAGQNQVVAINRGKSEGLDLGTVLQLYRTGRVVRDRTGDKQAVKLPDEQYGTLFIFRLFDHVSYGLIMQVTDAVQVGDAARTPE
jgi:hypothetical protein